MGLEPTREYTHKILSLARLPIPTLPLTVSVMLTHVSSTKHTITQLKQFVNTFFKFFQKIFLLEKLQKQVDKTTALYYNSFVELIDGLQKWRNWQTRTVQVRMVAILCGFKSHLLHVKREVELSTSLFYFYMNLFYYFAFLNSFHQYNTDHKSGNALNCICRDINQR